MSELRDRIIAALNDYADIRLPDGRLAIDRAMAVELVKSILAAQPESAGLDVAAIAEAWGNVMDGRRIGEGLRAARISAGTTTAEDWRAIAAEYDRLTAEETTR